MNRLRRPFFAALFAAALTAGCASSDHLPEAAPATPDVISSMQQAFAAANTNARLAAVTEVAPNDSYLAARPDNVFDFSINAAVLVTDTNGALLARGIVVNQVGSEIHVKYESAGQRPPAVGDVVIRFVN